MVEDHQAPRPSHPAEGDDEGEPEDLEQQVNHMAQKILDFSRTIPDLCKNRFSSVLVSMRPDIETGMRPLEKGGAEIQRNPNLELGELSENGALLAKEDPETANKVGLLKVKISSNVSSMPTILKRMKSCIARIDELDQWQGNPALAAFKRKRIQ